VIVHYLTQTPADDEDSTKAVPDAGDGASHPVSGASSGPTQAQTTTISSPGSA
jgi:hypothetical protein